MVPARPLFIPDVIRLKLLTHYYIRRGGREKGRERGRERERKRERESGRDVTAKQKKG